MPPSNLLSLTDVLCGSKDNMTYNAAATAPFDAFVDASEPGARLWGNYDPRTGERSLQYLLTHAAVERLVEPLSREIAELSRAANIPLDDLALEHCDFEWGKWEDGFDFKECSKSSVRASRTL